MIIKVKIDGTEIEFPSLEQQPLLNNGRTYVPVRALFEYMGYEVEWTPGSGVNPKGTASISKNGLTIEIGENSNNYTIDGTLHTHPDNLESMLVGGRMMIPIRGVLESIGCFVDWDADTQTVEVSTPTTGITEGYFKIKAPNGQYLTYITPVKNDDSVSVANGNGSDTQIWKIEYSSLPNKYHIKPAIKNSHGVNIYRDDNYLCTMHDIFDNINDTSFSLEHIQGNNYAIKWSDGSSTRYLAYNGTTAYWTQTNDPESWTLAPISHTPPAEGITSGQSYYINNIVTNLYLTVSVSNSKLIQHDLTSDSTQRFIIIYTGNGEYTIRPQYQPDKLVSVDSNGYVYIDDNYYLDAQKWYIHKTGNCYYFENKTDISRKLGANGSTLNNPVVLSNQLYLWTVKKYPNLNYATYPCKVMQITQDYKGERSHIFCSAGTPNDYPTDEACENDNNRSWMFCPCDEMEIINLYGVGNGKPNTIWLRSTSKVKMPCGEDYLVMMVIHPEDDDLGELHVGQKFRRGDAMFREGKDGATGDHFHISIGTGSCPNANGTYWAESNLGNNAWVLTTTQNIKIEEAFYIDPDFTERLINTAGIKFKTLF